MLKNILNLEGAQKLTNAEQKEINGGITPNCGVGGFKSSISSCLCYNGTYNPQTQSCSYPGAETGNIYENAIGCCYAQWGGE
jgi:hypothetical protein